MARADSLLMRPLNTQVNAQLDALARLQENRRLQATARDRHIEDVSFAHSSPAGQGGLTCRLLSITVAWGHLVLLGTELFQKD
jgi:hypothetical protein